MMWRRRLLYLLALVLAIVLHVFHTRYFSWLLLVVLVAYPVLGVLATLPFLRSCKLSLQSSTGLAGVGQALSFTLTCAGGGRVGGVKLRLELENRFFGTVSHLRLRVPPGGEGIATAEYTGEQSGVVCCRVRFARMLDVTGLIPLPLRPPAPVEVLVLPAVPAMTDEAAKLLETMAANPGAAPQIAGADREWKDVREYREGDSLRDVHWKLSARTGKTIVREYEKTTHHSARAAVLWQGKASEAERTLARALAVVRHMEDIEAPLALVWTAPRGEVGEITELKGEREGELEDLLWRSLAAPPPPGSLDPARVLPPGGAAVLVTADGVRLPGGGGEAVI